MPNTGERREITRRVNANEAEKVQESKALVSKTRQQSATTDAQEMARIAGNRTDKTPNPQKKKQK